MSEKVKLPEAVCDALGLVKVGLSNYEIVFACKNQLFGNKYYSHIESMVDCLNDVDEEELMRALVLGYEPEMTAEEQIRALWDQQEKVCDYANGIREGIKKALHILDVHYDWLDGDAE